MMVRAIAYLRVSTDDQARSGAGIGSQLESCRGHAERLVIDLVGSYQDEGISGATELADRPGLRAAIAGLGRGDLLLVARRDRLGRDPVVVANIERAVASFGARVVSVAGEGTEGDDSGSILQRRVVDAISENFRLVIKERTTAALAFRRSQGRRVGTVPIGRRLTGSGPLSKSDQPTALEPCPQDLATIALIRSLRSAGLSLRAIADELNRRGIPGKRGITKVSTGLWSKSTIHEVLARLIH